jgi:hypothetical protein
MSLSVEMKQSRWCCYRVPRSLAYRDHMRAAPLDRAAATAWRSGGALTPSCPRSPGGAKP